MIKLSQVSKTFDGGKSFVVKQVSFEVKTGETLVLLGSSGCGKTTTLKMINRLVQPSSGIIEIDGQDNRQVDSVALRRSIGYVFQGIGLFPHMTIAENVAIVLRLQNVAEAERMARARELLAFVNLDPDDYAERFPDELSGGQQQRVGVARALANKPEYLLMDEPFGALDAITREALQSDFIQLKNKLGITVIFVTHDVFEAIRLGDRIAVMHDGELEQIGSKEELINQPASDFVAELFSKTAEQLTLYSEHLG